jgi:hypothetical protein
VDIITPSNEDKCDLFGAFGYIMQLILGVLSFFVLVIKRLKEKPMRPWKIWFFVYDHNIGCI